MARPSHFRLPTSRRVAVTGLGVVSPLGLGWEATWSALLAGRSGVGPISAFDSSRFQVHLGAEVRGFEPQPWIRRSPPEALGRASQLAVAAARLALADAGLDLRRSDPTRTSVILGTTSGEPGEVEAHTDRLLGGEPGSGAILLQRYPCHLLAVHVAREIGAGGRVEVVPTACAAGNYAVAWGADLLRSGRADLVLAGGADAFSRITFAGFARLGAVAPEVCAPFDRERRGMIPGEGAAVLVLETLEAARRRGGRVWAEVAGYGLSCDAHHMTATHPEGDGPARAMCAALADAEVEPREIDYISAHGTGTPTNDKVETLAVKRAFGDPAYGIPMSSVKSMLGHTMGAASAIEAGVCCLAVTQGRIPPTINYRHPDPECDLDVVPNQARELSVELAMNNAYAFGGNNASVLFRRVRE